MDVFSLSYPHQLSDSAILPTVAAIGFFDGLHKGHQKVIKEAVDIAKSSNQQVAVITFDPHPSVVLNKNNTDIQYLTPLDEKIQLISGYDVDRLYVVKFNTKLAQLMPSSFIDHFIHGLNITHLVAGFDFTFGYKGSGNMDNILQHTDKKLLTTKIGEITDHEEKVSSTRIRKALKDGDIEEAERLLSRDVSIKGEVIHGDKRGRTIGYPTANIELHESYFLPKIGVYAVDVEIDGEKYYGMANLGYKPTFSDQRLEPKIEVHILDFNEDIYGQFITISWKKYIRSEKKFQGIDELVGQLQQDEKEIRNFFQL